MIKILLLTNSDSDNVGDQVIEACDISLIQAVMQNLGVQKDAYQIVSRPAGLISKKYVKTRNECLLISAAELIKNSDIIIFGGAPVFNFQYQIFYERTAVTLEIAQKYGKPVIFSAIGIEGYSKRSKKCQGLKKTLNFDCVKQITTRDDIVALRKYVEQERIITAKVSDPAVFSAQVLKNSITQRKNIKQKVGIFVIRREAFGDNGVKFSYKDAAELWKGIVEELESKGYDYELLTSGHYADEAYLDYLIRDCDISEKKCVFNMNTPEKLIQRISSYDAVISCRLHPSIVSFALDVSSVGIVWNQKVSFFIKVLDTKIGSLRQLRQRRKL